MNDSEIMTYLGNYVFLIIAAIVFCTIVYWKLFTKAGRAGWLSLIPIVNAYVIVKIAKLPGWFLLLYIIPIVNVVVAIYVTLKFCEAYGKSTLFAVLTIFFGFITLPILAFGSSQYIKD